MVGTRRSFLGRTLLAAGATAALPVLARADDATPQPVSPVAESLDVPGYAVVRVRALATPELTQAVFPDVMHRFLPQTEAVPGFYGYLFAVETADPANSITVTLMDTMEAALAADDVAKTYVAGLDPRLMPETPLAEQGPVRVYARTNRSPEQLPPFLSGCQITLRNRTNADNADIDAMARAVNEDLAPILQSMDGFVLYCWLQTPGGRVGINIWETAEQTAAGDAAIADWVAATPIMATSGETEVRAGVIGYADVLGIG